MTVPNPHPFTSSEGGQPPIFLRTIHFKTAGNSGRSDFPSKKRNCYSRNETNTICAHHCASSPGVAIRSTIILRTMTYGAHRSISNRNGRQPQRKRRQTSPTVTGLRHIERNRRFKEERSVRRQDARERCPNSIVRNRTCVPAEAHRKGQHRPQVHGHARCRYFKKGTIPP